MGFLDLLKKIFSSRSKEEVNFVILEINIMNLNAWIGEYFKKIYANSRTSIEDLIKKIENEKEILASKLDKLKAAKIKDVSLTDRAKHIMEGNKNTYLSKVSSFVSSIEIPKNEESIMEFCDSYSSKLEEFDKAISKNHRVVQEFFLNEANGVYNSIRNLSLLIKGIKSELIKNKVDKIKEINLLALETVSTYAERENLNQRAENERHSVSDLSIEISNLESNTEALKKQNEYLEFSKNNTDKIESEEKLRVEEKKLESNFSEIEPALKKYSKLYPENAVVKRYLRSTLEAFKIDKNFEIAKLLSEINSLIAGNKLDLKDKKKDKIMKELNNMDRNFFETYKNKFEEMNFFIEEVTRKLSYSKISEKINGLNKLKIAKEAEKASSEDKLAKLEKDLSLIDFDEIIRNFEFNFSRSFGETVKLVC